MPKRSHHEDEHQHDRGRDHSGDNPLIHARIIERRWLGSVPPTPALYARALQQWLALPGAVVRSAADVRPHPEPRQPTDVSSTSKEAREDEL